VKKKPTDTTLLTYNDWGEEEEKSAYEGVFSILPLIQTRQKDPIKDMEELVRIGLDRAREIYASTPGNNFLRITSGVELTLRNSLLKIAITRSRETDKEANTGTSFNFQVFDDYFRAADLGGLTTKKATILPRLQRLADARGWTQERTFSEAIDMQNMATMFLRLRELNSRVVPFRTRKK